MRKNKWFEKERNGLKRIKKIKTDNTDKNIRQILENVKIDVYLIILKI